MYDGWKIWKQILSRNDIRCSITFLSNIPWYSNRSRCKSRTSCISIRYTRYYVSATSPVGSMILLPVTDRENANTCSGLEMDSPNKTSGMTRTLGVKFPGVSRQQASSWQRDVLWKQGIHAWRVVLTHRSHGDLTNVMHEPSRMTRILIYFYFYFFLYFLPIEFSRKLPRQRIRSTRMR